MHESTYDAQAVYNELVAHYTKSTKASLDLTQLMQYLTSLRIGDGTWRGMAASFVLNFQDKIREFEKIADTSDHFSDGWKIILLQNAVHPLAEL